MLFVAVSAGGQTTKTERNLIKKGNQYYSEKKYSDAENCYNQALEKNPNSQIAKFNLATTLLRKRSANRTPQDSVLEKRAFDMLNAVAADRTASKSLRQKSYYDLGRLAYDKEDYQSSVKHFEDALRIDPTDNQARKNLRMAQKKLQQGGRSQSQNQDEQEKQKNDNNNQDRQNSPQQQQPPKPQNVNTDQILKAMQNEEKNTRDKVNKRKAAQLQGRPRSQKPW